MKAGDICAVDCCIIGDRDDDANVLPYLRPENIESMSGRIVLHSNGNSNIQGVSNCFRFDPEHILYEKLQPHKGLKRQFF